MNKIASIIVNQYQINLSFQNNAGHTKIAVKYCREKCSTVHMSEQHYIYILHSNYG